MSGRVIEMLRMITVTRAHSAEKAEMKQLDEKFQEVRNSGIRIDTLNALFSSFNIVLFSLFNLFTLITAGYLKYAGILEMGVGDVILLTSYFGSLT